MSEKLFRVLLPELATVIIRCMATQARKKCTGAIEMSADDLRQNRQLACPVCGAVFSHKGAGSQSNTLEDLGLALDAVKAQGLRDNFQVEFVVPDSDA